MYNTTSVSKYTTFWEFFLRFEKRNKMENIKKKHTKSCRGRETAVPRQGTFSPGSYYQPGLKVPGPRARSSPCGWPLVSVYEQPGLKGGGFSPALPIPIRQPGLNPLPTETNDPVSTSARPLQRRLPFVALGSKPPHALHIRRRVHFALIMAVDWWPPYLFIESWICHSHWPP
jgi:hypothetical protein